LVVEVDVLIVVFLYTKKRVAKAALFLLSISIDLGDIDQLNCIPPTVITYEIIY